MPQTPVIRPILKLIASLGIVTFAGAVAALPVLSAPSSIHFPSGIVQMGVTVTNVSGAPITLTGANLTGGPPAFPALGYFIVGFPFTCNPGVVMPPGGNCVVNYQYAQILPGANSEPVSITLGFNGAASFETMLVNLVADPPFIVPTLSRWLLVLLAALVLVIAVMSFRLRDA